MTLYIHEEKVLAATESMLIMTLSIYEEKILAVIESMLIWDILRNERYSLKCQAINILFAENKISTDNYFSDCPLCDFTHSVHKRQGLPYYPYYPCDICPWPGDGHERCVYYPSPYIDWRHSSTFEGKNYYANKVFELLSNIDI